jgi:hypothetical protein
MEGKMDVLLDKLVREKANAIINKTDYRNYVRKFSQEIGDVETAFLAGAIDAICYDFATLKSPRNLPSNEERKRLIYSILKL